MSCVFGTIETADNRSFTWQFMALAGIAALVSGCGESTSSTTKTIAAISHQEIVNHAQEAVRKRATKEFQIADVQFPAYPAESHLYKITKKSGKNFYYHVEGFCSLGRQKYTFTCGFALTKGKPDKPEIVLLPVKG